MVKALSKSDFMAGLSCPKYLWCRFNAREMILPVSAATQARFDQGHEVGALARTYFAGGAEGHTAERTKELLKNKKPIYEANFVHQGALCRADILAPNKSDWDIVEVKSAGKVKDENIYDVAFQRFCIEGTGLHIRDCKLMHINGEYVRKGTIDVKQLFAVDDITDAVAEILPEIGEKVAAMLKIVAGPMPEPEWGVDCVSPKECPVCSQEIAKLPDGNVTELYRIGKKAYTLLQDHVVRIKDLPDDFELTDRQEIQKKCAETGKPYVDKPAIKKFLKELQYPLYLLDFEAVNPAIPLFDGTHPFQNVPFQFSLHVIAKPGADAKHVEFLAATPDDPRKGVVEALKAIGPKGTILAYSMTFEKRVIEELAAAFPKEKWLHALVDRFEDLLIPFRNFAYYHPKQGGGCSIKDVLPALTGKSYAGLEIHEGDQAAQAFQENMYGKGKVDAQLRAALLEYCKQDTEAMVDLLRVLEKSVR